MDEVLLSAVLRTANLLGWTIFVLRTLGRDVPVSRTARQTICLVLVFGMAVFELGPLIQYGFLEQGTARFITTTFAGFSALGAWSLVFGERKK